MSFCKKHKGIKVVVVVLTNTIVVNRDAKTQDTKEVEVVRSKRGISLVTIIFLVRLIKSCQRIALGPVFKIASKTKPCTTARQVTHMWHVPPSSFFFFPSCNRRGVCQINGSPASLSTKDLVSNSLCLLLQSEAFL